MMVAEFNADKTPVEVCIVYSHADSKLRVKLVTHLILMKRQGEITDWQERQIVTGQEGEQAISPHLESARVILFLVSPDFLASEYCYGREVKRAIARHTDESACVIPVLLRPCDWQATPLGKFQALSTTGKTVTDPYWLDYDAAFTDIMLGIKNKLANWPEFTAPLSEKVKPRLVLLIDAERENYDAAKAQALLKMLQTYSGDDRLRISEAQIGPVTFTIEASPAALERLRVMADSGELSSYVGYPTKLSPATALPQVSIDDGEEDYDTVSGAIRRLATALRNGPESFISKNLFRELPGRDFRYLLKHLEILSRKKSSDISGKKTFVASSIERAFDKTSQNQTFLELIDGLKYPDIFVQNAACYLLYFIRFDSGGMKGAKSAYGWKSDDGLVRRVTIPKMAVSKDSSTVSIVYEILSDPNVFVRRQAFFILVQIGDASTIPALIKASKDENIEIRSLAVSTLGRVRDVSAIPALMEILKNGDREMRGKAASALGNIGDASAVPALITALKDSDKDVRNAVAVALKAIENSQSTSDLLES